MKFGTYKHLSQFKIDFIYFILYCCLIYQSYPWLTPLLPPSLFLHNKNIYLNNEWICCFSIWTRKIYDIPPFYYYYIKEVFVCMYLLEQALPHFFHSFGIYFGEPNKEVNNISFIFLVISACVFLCLCVSSSFSFTFFITTLMWICSRILSLLFFVQSTQHKGSWMHW